MPHGFPGHRASIATHPEGGYAPLEAVIYRSLAAHFGPMGGSLVVAGTTAQSAPSERAKYRGEMGLDHRDLVQAACQRPDSMRLATRCRSTGTKSASNQGCFFSHAVLRQLGWGSGKLSGK